MASIIQREKHGALLDSELLAEVYIELVGGKQAALTLESDDNSAQKQGDDADLPEIEISARPRPLAPRLTSDDIKAHQAMVDVIGDKAVWLAK